MILTEELQLRQSRLSWDKILQTFYLESDDDVSVRCDMNYNNFYFLELLNTSTGDNANIAAYVSVGIVAMAGLATVVFVKRRVNE